MKFTVELDEFWMDEDSGTLDEKLKSYVIHDVIMQIKSGIREKIETEISSQIQKQLEQCMYEYIQKEVKDFISEGKIRKSSYNKEEILIKDWIEEQKKRIFLFFQILEEDYQRELNRDRMVNEANKKEAINENK